MSRPNRAKNPAKRGVVPPTVQPTKPTPSAQLRLQTRKVLGKHYRAKYGVR